MPLTGLNTLPLPLGGTAENGWTAEQQSRVANDLAALRRTSPFAVLSGDTGSTPEISAYYGWNGVGSSFAPTITHIVNGHIRLTWPTSYEDNYGVQHAINIVGAVGAARQSSARKVSTDITAHPCNEIDIHTTTHAGVFSSGGYSLVVYAKPDAEHIYTDYDGDLSKKNSETEGEVPYGAVVYQDLRDNLRGTAHTKQEDGITFAKNVATARVFAGLWRAADKLRNNANPATADEGLDAWQNIYRVPVRPGAPKAELRRLCAAQFRAIGGAQQDNIEATFSELLGDLYIRIWYGGDEGSLDSPPECTYWPGINPGPESYNLGDGAWLSERAHLCVEVAPHESMALPEFYHRVNAQLFVIGRRLLPANMTFTWAENLPDGFDFELDEMDFGGMGFE